MTPSYPSALHAFTSPSGGTQQLGASTPPHSQQHIDVNAEVAAIEATLGIMPHKRTAADAVAYSTLGARLDATVEVNTADFGVKADGVTNDSTAMQNAVDFCLPLGLNLKVQAGTIAMITTSLSIDMDDAIGCFSMIGMGQTTTTFKWSGAIGSGVCGIDVLNPAQGAYPRFEGFTVQGPVTGAAAVDPNDAGQATAATGYGMRIPSRGVYQHLWASGWFGGFVIDGKSESGPSVHSDHSDIAHLSSQENVYGLYVIGNSNNTRDYNFYRCLFSRNGHAAIGIAESGELTDLTMTNCHFNSNPFPFWKEGASPSNTNYIGYVHFIRCKAEGPGNGYSWIEGTEADVQRLTGFIEFHGIETNGQATGGGGGINDRGVGVNNHTWRPWAITSLSRTSNVVTAVFASAPPLKVGDSIACYVSDNHALNDSINGGIMVKSVATTTVTWDQTGIDVATVAAHAGPVVGWRCGSFYESDLRISMLNDETTDDVDPELVFDTKTMDNVIITTFGDLIPKVFQNGTGLSGRKSSVVWRRGNTTAVLRRVGTGSFTVGQQLVMSTGGDVKKSTNAVSELYAGTALSAGSTTIAVTGDVLTPRWVWVLRDGHDQQWAVGGASNYVGPGAAYTGSAPADGAVLCLDPSNAGYVTTCPFTSGSRYFIVGCATAAGAGGLVDIDQIVRGWVTVP